MKKNILKLMTLIMFFSFCGKKGPLVLEPEKLPLAAVDLQVRQIGNQIELSWKFPALLSDKKSPFQLAQCRGVSIYHAAKPLVPETFLKKSELLAKPKISEITDRGNGTYSYALTFKSNKKDPPLVQRKDPGRICRGDLGRLFAFPALRSQAGRV